MIPTLVIRTQAGHTRRAPRWRIILWSTIAALLVLPLAAMPFTDEVAWGVEDVIAAAVLLVGAGAIYEAAARRTGRAISRAVIAAALAGLVLVIWAQAAVGVF